MISVRLNLGLELVTYVFRDQSFGAVYNQVLTSNFFFLFFDEAEKLLTCDALDFLRGGWLV